MQALREAHALLFGAAPLGELPDLVADDGEHLEEALVGLPDLAAEEDHDADDGVVEADGKGEAGPEVGLGRRGGPHEVLLPAHVGQPLRFVVGPDGAGESLAGVERRLFGGRLEGGMGGGGMAPDFGTFQVGLVGVGQPQLAPAPVELVADRFEEAGRGVGQGVRLGEDVGGQVLRLQAALVLLPGGDVAKEACQERAVVHFNFAEGNLHREGGAVFPAAPQFPIGADEGRAAGLAVRLQEVGEVVPIGERKKRR
jgi:hypothetical protein